MLCVFMCVFRIKSNLTHYIVEEIEKQEHGDYEYQQNKNGHIAYADRGQILVVIVVGSFFA